MASRVGSTKSCPAAPDGRSLIWCGTSASFTCSGGWSQAVCSQARRPGANPTAPTPMTCWPGFVGGVDLTADILDSLDPDMPAWTWGRRQDVGFIRRRVAQETAVHCWDAVNAIGCDKTIEQTLAVDGVDEFVDEVLPGLSYDLAGPAQTIRLHAHDSGDEWTVRAGEGAVSPDRTSRQAEATATATAYDLLLLLWGSN